MVFEAVVVEFLNKFLKQYVENLDTSQLKIGIWGGDVELNDLKIRTTLFDDLNLPLRVKWGKLGKFVMKIPWKNLYSSHVVINIQDLFMVIIPNTEFKYDAAKEEKWNQDKKQAKLKAVEEAKKHESIDESLKQNDSFLEKLLTQIIKNLQIVIKNVHIRYEDKTTVPGSPFSVGVTMSNLSAETTINDPTNIHFSNLMKEKAHFICKVINLDGLAIYWNSCSVLFSEFSENDLVNVLHQSIPKADYKPDSFTYLFGPLSASAFLRLNPKPEADGTNFTIPKIFVNVHLKEIELAVTHNQFCDVMSFLQDFQRLCAGAKYRKYRPYGAPVIGHAKEWWQFAYSAIVEDIIRRKKEWCWENIKNHRIMCRKYSELFKAKLSSKKMSADAERELNALENKLNVFNLILIREQVYMEVERNKEKRESRSNSWFSNWFGYGTESELNTNEDELVKKIERVMTSHEKEKLYKAIGYEESASPTNYPITFVEVQFWFHLDAVKMTIYDDHTKHLIPIMEIAVKFVKMEFEQRPSAFAFKFVMIIGKFQVTGAQEKDKTYPELITSNCKESESLIEILYETKPLNASCDHQIIINARPLSIIFHAATINLAREVFTTNALEDIEKIVAVTSASLPTFRKITSLGVQYAIEKQAILEVKVNIMSSHLIIPYKGVYHPDTEMLVILLGKLSIETEKNIQKDVTVKKLYQEGTTDEEIFSAVVSASYTKFKCLLTGVQVLFQMSGENWVIASKMQRSSLQFLEPTNLEVTIKKSLVMDDARIPKMIIEGKLPSLTFNFSEERFVSFVALACSIPTKTEKSIVLTKKNAFSSAWSIHSLGAQLESKLISKTKVHSFIGLTEYVQGIDLVGRFEMSELSLNVTKSTVKTLEIEKKTIDLKERMSEEKFLNFSVMKLEIEFTGKTFETIALLKLGGIEFYQYYHKTLLPFLSAKTLDHDYYIFVVEYVNLDTKIPDFYTARDAIINRLTLNIKPLNLVLNREALVALIEFVTNVQRKVDLAKEHCFGRWGGIEGTKGILCVESSEITQSDKKVISKGRRFRKKGIQKEVVDFFLQASLDEMGITVEHGGKGHGLAEFNLKGFSVDISTRKSYTTLDVNIREIFVLDLNPQTKHKKIVSSLENRTLSSRVTFYNKEYFGSENVLDMSVDAEFGGIQCIILNVFFSRAFEFLSVFETRIRNFKEGATFAAQKAKENVVKAFQNSAQICLNIKITAPLLLIPKTSLSLETLAIDLGVLTMKNSITELDYTSDDEIEGRPLIDTSKLHLQNLKVSRYILSEDFEKKEKEKTFLVPVSFQLILKRNLSRNWFKVIPDLEILARIATIHVTLTHEDFCAIVNILKQNLEEGRQVSKIIESSSSYIKIEQKSSRKTERQQSYHHELVMDEHHTKLGSNYNTSVKFMFFMGSFVFNAEIEPSQESDNEELNSGLARFVLETMSVKGRVFSDNSIYTSMMLESCLLDDTRPGKKGRLTRLMERTGGVNSKDPKEADSVNSMVEVVYQKKQNDTFIDVRVFKFTLILSMDFLQKLGVFFTLETEISKGIEDLKHPENLFKPKTPLKDDINDDDYNEAEKPTTFTVNIRLEKPDIIIVENIDSINTEALIFHTEMIIKNRYARTRQVITATLSNIELYSCCFNPSKRPHTLNQIIKPFTISVAGSTPEDSGLHIDICFTEIYININPNTIDLMSKCYETLLKDSSFVEKNLEDEDYSDLWDVKPFDPNNYWFLKTEEGIDVLSLRYSFSLKESDSFFADEICLLAIPSIKVSLEGLPTSHAQPLMLLDMGFQMQCYNWSLKLTIVTSLTVKLDYYNKSFCAWEPLIEPVEKHCEQELKHSYIPWELSCCMIYGDEEDREEFRPPKVQITLSCTETLQLTVTKTSVEIMKRVLEIYSEAAKKHVVKYIADRPPFVVKNETGLVVELLLEKSELQVIRSLSDEYKIVRLESYSEVELKSITPVESETKQRPSFSTIKKKTRIFVKFPIFEKHIFELPLGGASKRYYPFPAEFNEGEVWGLVSDVSIVNDSIIVILRSVLKVINYFIEPINIHSLSEDGKVVEYVGTVEGNSSFYLPFHAVYSVEKTLFFSVNGYLLSNEPFVWANLKTELKMSVLLQCCSKVPENKDPFFIQAFGEMEQIYFGNTNRKNISSITFQIHLQPTVKIFNSLPVSLTICFQGSAKEKLLHSGNNIQISNAEPGTSAVTIRIDDYLEKEWSCKETIPKNPSEFLIWKFVSYNGLTPETLNLGVHVKNKRDTAVYTLYCPYFMVNKTEHLLAYKFEHCSSVFYHPGNFKLPLMFSPTSKKFFSKKLATLQVNSSSWSDKFPVDVAGSGGTVECKDKVSGITYQVSVTITLTHNSLTKIIVFTPFFVFVNSLNFAIEYRECELEEDWLDLPSGSCIPFWPKSGMKEKTICIRLKDSNTLSPPFAYDSTDACLLKLFHKCGGIFVNIKATQSGTYITFSSYESGQAPALILNYSAKDIILYEQDVTDETTLKPFEQVMYAWKRPAGERKIILMDPMQTEDIVPLDEDTMGLAFTLAREPVQYVSFLDGTQRILLFTDNRGVFNSISSLKMQTVTGIEVLLKIQGIGVSLVNNINRVEILYLSLMSSGIIWEARKLGKNRFKQIKEPESLRLEEAYQKYTRDSELNANVNPNVKLFDVLQVDFEKMEIIQPHKKELRRMFEPGLWLAFRKIEDQLLLHVKINKIQIDNQLHDCVFPVVLAPVPPPKSVATTFEGDKPFFEMSVVKIAADRRGIVQYKYFKTLIQEFQVKIDIGFLHQIYLFLSEEEISDEQRKINFQKDIEFTQKPLKAHVEIVSTNEHKNFYELLHFSPLKFHFSFSLAGKIEHNDSLPPSFKVMLQSLGVTLTDIHDVVFRLSYLEKKNVFLTNSELISEAITHYYGQIVKQAYVLLLGLDVIGNPYGLIVNIGRGVEAFFYEPFQGMIQGPAEFRAGMAIGCKRLFRNTIGSTAGTLGKLTETLGKGLAVLSLDKEYQMQRMVNQNRQENIQASMARGGKGLVMGVVEGFRGIVQKPVKGAKEEGVGGFLKGMGKGMIGLVTRPVTGVVDFAATSFNAVKRANADGGENKRLRPPRFFRDDSLVEPYNLYEAQGNSIFYSMSRMKYYDSDKYEFHLFLRENEIVLLTDKRILLAELSETFGTWQEHMTIPWKAIPGRPQCHTKGIALAVPRKSVVSKAEKPEIKILLIEKESVKEEMYNKMVELYDLEQESSVY